MTPNTSWDRSCGHRGRGSGGGQRFCLGRQNPRCGEKDVYENVTSPTTSFAGGKHSQSLSVNKPFNANALEEDAVLVLCVGFRIYLFNFRRIPLVHSILRKVT